MHQGVCDWVHMCACTCMCIVRQVGGCGPGPLTPTLFPRSYIDNQEHLQHLDAVHLKGLGMLRDL